MSFDEWWSRPVRPIMANPGGTVAPEEVIGRDDVVENALRAVYGHGALLTGDRRMGKTAVLGPIARLLEAGACVVLRVGGETLDPNVLASRLADALRHHGRFRGELEKWDVEVDVSKGPFKLHRHSGSQDGASQDDLFRWAARASAPDRLVLIIDEVTVAAQAFAASSGGAAGFLHELRNARQTNDNVSMIFSGSVGLHHVVGDMSVVNDLVPIRVGPLEQPDACYLARCLLAGTQGVFFDPAQERAVCESVADAADGIAFYLHHLVDDARRTHRPLTPATVGDLVTAAIDDPDDPWHVRHYRDRLRDYYGGDADLAGLMLDHYAVEGRSTVGQMRDHLATLGEAPLPTRAGLAALVDNLEQDHYLRRDPDGTDRFASALVRRAWIHLRHL